MCLHHPEPVVMHSVALSAPGIIGRKYSAGRCVLPHAVNEPNHSLS
jgi:hypothetical protein